MFSALRGCDRMSSDWPFGISDQSKQQKHAGRTDTQLAVQTTTNSAQKHVVTVATQLSLWKLFSSWVTSHQLYTANSLQSDAMVHILHAMSTQKIERVFVGYKGTQLKATFILAGWQKVVFKPMRQGCVATEGNCLIPSESQLNV